MSEELTIEKNIPCPPKRKYPFGSMEVGDSVFIPGRSSGSIRYALRDFLKTKMKFTARNWERDGVQGVRVWRVK